MKGTQILILIILVLVASAAVFIGWNRYFDPQTNYSPQTEEEELTQYKNERFGFSFSYPNDWYRHNEEGNYVLVSVSPMGPDDPKRPSGASLLASFNVRLLSEESVDAYIRTVKDSPYNENFTFSEITLSNSAVVPLISYLHPIGTGRTVSFIELNDGTILRVWFSSSEEKYMQILRSFRW